jgi:hypothetical protein
MVSPQQANQVVKKLLANAKRMKGATRSLQERVLLKRSMPSRAAGKKEGSNKVKEVVGRT